MLPHAIGSPSCWSEHAQWLRCKVTIVHARALRRSRAWAVVASRCNHCPCARCPRLCLFAAPGPATNWQHSSHGAEGDSDIGCWALRRCWSLVVRSTLAPTESALLGNTTLYSSIARVPNEGRMEWQHWESSVRWVLVKAGWRGRPDLDSRGVFMCCKGRQVQCGGKVAHFSALPSSLVSRMLLYGMILDAGVCCQAVQWAGRWHLGRCLSRLWLCLTENCYLTGIAAGSKSSSIHYFCCNYVLYYNKYFCCM